MKKDIDKKVIIKKIVDTYNNNSIQQVIAMEEMAELQKEISKYLRGHGNKEALTEEMADVLIMIEQLKLIHNISEDDLEEEIIFKLIRMNERMEELD